jgi:hypothetical protein
VVEAIWAAGLIQAAIVAANVPLPGKLRVREHMADLPIFLRQIFYVHWGYIVVTVGLFSWLCLGFARELAGASALGRFLSGFMAAFWLSRLGLQWFYYDRAVRRDNRALDALYGVALLMLSAVLGFAALHPEAS